MAEQSPLAASATARQTGWSGAREGVLSRERAGGDLEGVLRQALRLLDAEQRALHQLLPRLVEAAPRVEGGGEAGGHLRVALVEGDDLLGHEVVARAVGGVEGGGVGAGKGVDHRAHRVGVGAVVRLVLEQRADVGEGGGGVGGGLDGEPLVDHERLLVRLCARVEGAERLVACGTGGGGEGGDGGDRVGHARGVAELREAERLALLVAELREVAEHGVAQPALAHRLGGDRERLAGRRRERLVDGEEVGLERGREGLASELERGDEAVRVDDVHLLGERGEVWEGERVRLQRRLQAVGEQGRAEGVDKGGGELEGLAARRLGGEGEDDARGELLRGVPPVERVGVVGGQEGERRVVAGQVHLDGGGEAAEHRGGGARRDPLEGEGLLRLRQLEHLRVEQGLARAVQQPHRHRDVERLLRLLARRRLRRLRERERVDLARLVVRVAHLDRRRAGLQVPPLELGQVAPVRVGHRRPKVVARDRLPVVPLEVEVHALAEAVGAEQRAVHPDHLGALVVHRHGVEVVHRDVRLRPDGVRHRPGVLHELGGAHDAHVLDPLDGLGGHVGGEVLVSVDGEPLLERELEPVAARDAVARPVVEVLVAHHALHPLVVGVGGGRRLREHARRVEDVEALVLHRAHVEVVDGDDVVHVEVVLETVRALVPRHRVLERLHRPVALVDVLRLGPDGQPHHAARHRGERVLDPVQLGRDAREEVRRLAKRVLELGPVPPARKLARADLVAVGEEERVRLLVRLHSHHVRRHHVRPVLRERDPPEPLRFALGHKVPGRLVQTGELSVLLRLDRHDRRELERAQRGTEQRQALRSERVVGALLQSTAVELDGAQAQLFAVQKHRRAGRGIGGGLDGQLGLDERLLLANNKVEPERLDRVRRWGVIFPKLLLRLLRLHNRRHGQRTASKLLQRSCGPHAHGNARRRP
mmetsp:Transcript_26474/g.45311  ORF Transcript_26474/g.45311 Transcript_26474/m.45311 type:complete len:932 (-) Transcript_26474:74-2869(-)